MRYIVVIPSIRLYRFEVANILGEVQDTINRRYGIYLHHSDLTMEQAFFLLAAAWVDPGGAPFSQLNKGVKDAMVESTKLVECQFMTKTCKKAKLKNKIQHTKRKRKKETIHRLDQDCKRGLG